MFKVNPFVLGLVKRGTECSLVCNALILRENQDWISFLESASNGWIKLARRHARE